MGKICTILTIALAVAPLIGAFASVQDDIVFKSRQIEEIQRQIDQYQRQIESTRSQARTLQGEITGLNAQIGQIILELKSLGISISKTNLQIGATQAKISAAEGKISKDQVILAQYLRIVYQNDRETLTNILLKNETISDFFNDLNSVKTNQDNLKDAIVSIKELKVDLEERKNELENQKDELQRQERLEQIEKRSLDQSKTLKDKLLKDTKGQESKFQEMVKEGQLRIQRIEAEIFYLNQNGVSVDDAIKYGNLAALATGIRPAFLLAELEIESGIGQNVGKCNRAGDPPSKSYRVVMKPDRDIQPFLAITAQLGLDAETMPVSCKPAYGWGGAMGPAQFIPSTWLGYAAEVARLVGRVIANPWNIEDAFTAASIKLARGGATGKTPVAEIAASKTYFSGNSRCSTAACNSYANTVQRVAAELERNL